ncbi:FapA family protein [Ruminococcus sp. HUN007]|uniref:DUF342 domain-containing protein n=1 Tax=Ruminococcus sp. HUN007 TaxID=1514668 RepID=UPI0005D15719|nr:FapA family protein [Ruminococcus sp. HUN007]
MKLFGRERFTFGKTKKEQDADDNQAVNSGENTDEASAALKQTDESPENGSAAEKKKTDERLGISENSKIYKLWNEYPESVRGDKFDPLGFMYDKIQETHDELKENFYRIHADTANFKDFDANQKEIAEFIKELSQYSGRVLRTVSKGFEITQEQIEKIKNIAFDENGEFSETRLRNSLLNDSSLASLGGFRSSEELKKIIAAVRSGDDAPGKKETDAVYSETEEADSLPAFSERDAEIKFKLSSDLIHAWVFILPPGVNGKDVTVSGITEILAQNGVIFGIDESMAERIEKEKLYFKLIEIARGKYPVNGSNGKVRELFSREINKINLVEDEHGRVNNKELGLIKSVHKGDVLAEIELPTEAADGMQVTGEPVQGTDGEYPKVPAGTNTKISEDKKTVTADADGELYFQNGIFGVRKVLKINHDIDLSVGNIDFAGDLIINGNIREGFSVKCSGNMKINGLSESAEISAGGNIFIEKGMFGGSDGSITAGGNLNCKYLENCRVDIRGNLSADQVLRCTVSADGFVDVSGVKGRIIGGSITGGKGISANFIGTQSGMGANVTLTTGMTSVYLKQRSLKAAELAIIEESLAKLMQNIRFLEAKKNSLNQLQKALLEKLVLQIKARKIQRDELTAEIEEIDKKSRGSRSAVEIKCGQLRSAVEINFDGFRYNISKELNNFRVFKDGPKIIARANGFEKVITDKA